MTRDEVVAFFDQRQAVWQRRDPEQLALGHAVDGTVVSPMLGSLRGRVEIAKSYSTLFRAFSDFTFIGETLLIDGDRVVQPFTVTAHHTGHFMGLAGTGRAVQFQGVMLYDMKHGLIGNEQRVYDFTGVLMQMGVLKSRPSIASRP